MQEERDKMALETYEHWLVSRVTGGNSDAYRLLFLVDLLLKQMHSLLLHLGVISHVITQCPVRVRQCSKTYFSYDH